MHLHAHTSPSNLARLADLAKTGPDQIHHATSETPHIRLQPNANPNLDVTDTDQNRGVYTAARTVISPRFDRPRGPAKGLAGLGLRGLENVENVEKGE